MDTTLVNATPIEVAYRDGRKETIALGELSIRQLYVFIKHLGGEDTPALVALSAGKPVDWVDTLEDASFDLIVKRAIELNFPRAVARCASDPIAAAKLAPLLSSLAQVLPSLQAINGPSSPPSSPTPAASASAVETGSVSST